MKKTLLIFLILSATIKKKKKNSSESSEKATTLSLAGGTYKLFLTSDTSYERLDAHDSGPIDVTNKWETGDTSFLNYGTSKLIVEPNSVVDYNGTYAMSVSIQFTSAANGTETQFGNSYPITYSLKTGLENDGSGDGASNIYVVNSQMIKIVSFDISNGLENDGTVAYYKKQ